MSKHVINLRAAAVQIKFGGREADLETTVSAAADALEIAERENRLARKCLRYIVEQSARPGCLTGTNPYEAARQGLEQLTALRRRAGGKRGRG